MFAVHQTAAVLRSWLKALAVALPTLLATQVQNVIDMPANDKLSLFEASRCVMSWHMPSCHGRLRIVQYHSGSSLAVCTQDKLLNVHKHSSVCRA